MKKIFLTFICMALTFSLFACGRDDTDNTPTDGTDTSVEGAPQTDERYPGIIFYDKGDGSYLARICPTEITEHINIPDTRNGLTVNEIVYLGPNEFVEFVTTVTIPDAVTVIPDNTFVGFKRLESITVPDGVTSIGNNAFLGCKSLVGAVIGNSVRSIGNRAFYECIGLAEVTVPDSVTSIGDSAFSGCVSLVGAAIGNGVTDIGNSVFSGCERLTDITLGNSVRSIGAFAFSGCYSLGTVAIPSSVTSIAENAFENCDSLTGVYVTDLAKWCEISFETTRSNPLHYAKNLYLNGELITALILPNGLTGISDYAFSGGACLLSITIPESIKSIDESAFIGCSKLIEVVNRSELNITAGSESNGYVGYFAKEVHNGESKIIKEGDYLFYTYDGVSYLMGYAGTDTSITLPESYNGRAYEIYEYSFFNCNNLNDVTIPNGLTKIGDHAFSSCGMTSIVIPESVKSIGSYAFTGCSRLTEINIPKSITSISDYAFYGCSGLISANIPAGVSSIGRSAFDGCNNLTSITIPRSVSSIGDYAFKGCYKLVEVINRSQLSLAPGSSEYGYAAKYAKEVHNGESKIVKEGDYLFYTFGGVNYLLGYVGYDRSIALPESYRGENYEIYGYAFYNCVSLRGVVIPNGVTGIGDSAFYGCSGLTGIDIPSSISSISHSAFYKCTSLKKVSIPNSVTSIEHYAFEGCESLVSVTIPSSVTSIGSCAFFDCTALTSVVIPRSVKSIDAALFHGCSSLTVIYYGGTADEWSQIRMGENNGILTETNRYYYSEAQPTADGNYWHYDENSDIAVW